MSEAFVFAVKSTDSLSFFENSAECVHIFFFSEKDGRRWLESVLLARVSHDSPSDEKVASHRPLLTTTVLLYQPGTQHALGWDYLRLRRNIRQIPLAFAYAQGIAYRCAAIGKCHSNCHSRGKSPPGVRLRTRVAAGQAR